MDRPLTLDEALSWDPAVEALADQTPLFEPRSQHGYHAVTYGYLVGEVVKRVSGISLGAYFAQEIAAPLGLDFWIGTPAEAHPRVAPLLADELPDSPELTEAINAFMGPDTILGRALAAPGGAIRVDPSDTSSNPFNTPEMFAAEVPAANGITNAASVARLYAGLIGSIEGVALFDEATLDRARTQLTSGPDAVLMGLDIQFSAGWMVPSSVLPLGTEGSSFGHYGYGGSLGFADAQAGIGFGYVMNKTMLGVAGDPRTAGLIQALYAAIG